MSTVSVKYPQIWAKLSAKNQDHAQKYMEFLYQQQQQQQLQHQLQHQQQREKTEKAKAKPRIFGILKGKMVIPEGFDDPMPELKEYM